MSTLSFVLIALALISILLNLWQWVVGRRFPLHRPLAPSAFFPPVSILKPLKGCDSETERCLESWFQQNYPGELEIIFATPSANDPVCPIVHRLIETYPQVSAKLIIADPVLGPNGKVSALCYLTRHARHEHLVICDADVFAKNNFLSHLVSGLADETVGLVNCFYILAHPTNLPMRLESIAVNADFWTQVLQSVSLRPMDFALGAAMATTKTQLARIGGFEGLLELLADDYQLGNRIAKSGRNLTICPVPVECRTPGQDWRSVWRHQLRWARTIRASQPVGYFFSILGNGTIWPLLAMGPAPWLVPIGLALRMLAAVSNYRRLTGQFKWWVAVLAPVKDLGQVVLWAFSFAGNVITWHDQRFCVSQGGKLTPTA
jgi:ceramide glucosyltransferase